MYMYRVFSCEVERRGVLWPVCSLGKNLLFALLHSVLQGPIFLLVQVSWFPTFAFQSPNMKRTFFGVLVLKGLESLHRTVQHQRLQCSLLGHRLGLLWHWMVCLGNRDHSVVFEMASKYCISDSFVDHDGYSISSKGFLPKIAEIKVIWIKFTHLSPFEFTDS